ncbi:unnamed protein product [Cyprideis torosa]|uniref:Transmembrane 9 superfamily member n=1 Tax=Cyprideis torosa TaxID=163714 RepID=A0A7R8WRL8_9CRUS|nr:unnamed protein product [Cyprideis torosa]CAG0903956.1 unnamed protein product [Cyprideis torosa]
MKCKLGIFLLSTLIVVSGDEHSHTYSKGEEVVLWMNTVGPYHNRQETYAYFSLPFCKGPKETIEHYHETLAEALQGVELDFSGLEISFLEDVPDREYCKVLIQEYSLNAFTYAIKNHYWYQMYMDDLPIWGIVGEVGDDGLFYLWTHKRLEIGYNGNQIVDVNLTSEKKVALKLGEQIPFTYEVKWVPSSVKFDDRFDKYLDPSFFQHRDLNRYSRDEKDVELDDMEKDLGDEYGWKQVHGDVFRAPSYPMIFATLIGCGYQIAIVTFCVILLATLGELYTE